MTIKEKWICKCGLEHKITRKAVLENKIKSCICGELPTKEDIIVKDKNF